MLAPHTIKDLKPEDFKSYEQAKEFFDKQSDSVKEIVRLQEGTDDVEKMFRLIGATQDIVMKAKTRTDKVFGG